MESQAGSGRRAPRRESRFRRKLLTVIAAAVVALAVWIFLASVLPRWWSHEVGRQVHGDLTTGGLLGFVYGFAGTVLPLLVLGLVWRFARRSEWAWILGVVVAALLASPNLVTLGIAIGTGSAAHAAERTLDVEAPWFRGGMIVGVLAGVVVVAVVVYALTFGRRPHRGQSVEEDGQRAAP